MIDLCYWPTPNGWKISIALEEMGLEYRVRYVNIGRGEQFEPEFREYICGAYSIADMACWPWIVPHERHGQRIGDFSNLHRWYETMKTRPGVRRGFDVGKDIRRAAAGGPDEEARRVLFGQRAR